MGNYCSCVSFDSSQQVEDEATVKLIVHDGGLQEFSFPIKVSYLLQGNPGCFICNSDDMDFDTIVKAVRENEVLQPGQLYFALPLDWLRRPLKAEEMAALAVKATAAFSKSGGVRNSGTRRIQAEFFSGEENGRSCQKVVPEVGGKNESTVGLRRGNSRNGGAGGKGMFTVKFKGMLSSIPE